MKTGGGAIYMYMNIHMCPDEGQISSKVSHTQHSLHRSLTLCPLHTREQEEGGEEELMHVNQ